MPIYTKSGDMGETSLLGDRTSKSDPRVAAYGTLDELNSWLGLVLSYPAGGVSEGAASTDRAAGAVVRADASKSESTKIIAQIQPELFNLGTELATRPLRNDAGVGGAPAAGPDLITKKEIARLEEQIDKLSAELPVLQNFILPGGSRRAAALQVARTVCRRAERLVVAIREQVRPEIVAYLNRLSDLLFVLARFENHKSGKKEKLWTSKKD